MNCKLPLWLRQNEHGDLPKCRKTFLRADYLEKTLSDIQKVLGEDIYLAIITRDVGLLQRIEPQVKLSGFIIMLFATGLTTNIFSLVFLNIVLLFLAFQSRIRMLAYFLRVCIPVLLFTGIAVLPGITSWVTPGETLFNVYSGLIITKQGLKSAVFVLLRSMASLGLATLLIRTTRWSVLTRSMGWFGVPSTLVMVLDLTYRYLILFMFLFMDYLFGRKSRLVASERNWLKLQWIGSAIAGFLRMVWEYSQEITQAMQARGYTGGNCPKRSCRIGVLEICTLLFIIVICCIMWGGTYFDQTIGI